ncbi:hypothetical protein [Wenjunlia vitaminophila]|uniref:hypothetical protein n=1 Tax=Wenjunlia vitaminophila TaxID=76728 RepID=UPI0004770498|nr:hypothetical protein [Wenjunlia vitaminophila]
MPAPYPYGETVTVVRREPVLGPDGRPMRDDRGQPVLGSPQEIPMHGCVVTPRQELPQVGGAEQQARDMVIVGWTVYAPPGSEVRTTDQVRIRGVVCEVTGEPGDWRQNVFTGTRGPVQFAADRVTG